MGKRSRRFIVMMPGLAVFKLNRGSETAAGQAEDPYVPLEDFQTSSPLTSTGESMTVPLGRQITSTPSISAIRSDILLYDYLRENTALLNCFRNLLHMKTTAEDIDKMHLPKPSAAILGYGESSSKSGDAPNSFTLALEISTRMIRGNFSLFSLMFGIDLHLPCTYAETISQSSRADSQAKYAALTPPTVMYTVDGKQKSVPLMLMPIETLLFPIYLMAPGDYSARSLFHPNRIRHLYLELLLRNSLLTRRFLRFYTISELSSIKLECHGSSGANPNMKTLGSFPELSSKHLLNKNIKGTRYTLSAIFSEDIIQDILSRSSTAGLEKEFTEIQEKNISINLQGGTTSYKRGRRRQSLSVSPQLLSSKASSLSIEQLSNSKGSIKPVDLVKDIYSMSFLQQVSILFPLRTTTEPGCIVFSDLQFLHPFQHKTGSVDALDATKSIPTSPKGAMGGFVFTVSDANGDSKKVIPFSDVGGKSAKLLLSDVGDLQKEHVAVTKMVIGGTTIVPSAPIPVGAIEEIAQLKELEPYYKAVKRTEESLDGKKGALGSKGGTADDTENKLIVVEYFVKITLSQPFKAYVQENNPSISNLNSTSAGEGLLQSKGDLTASVTSLGSQNPRETTSVYNPAASKLSLRGSQRSAARSNEPSDTNSMTSSDDPETTNLAEHNLIAPDVSFTRATLNTLLSQRLTTMREYSEAYGNSVISGLSPDFRTGVLVSGQATLATIEDLSIYTVSGNFNETTQSIAVHSQTRKEAAKSRDHALSLSSTLFGSPRGTVIRNCADRIFTCMGDVGTLTLSLTSSTSFEVDCMTLTTQYPSFRSHLSLALALTRHADKPLDLVSFTQKDIENLAFSEVIVATWRSKPAPFAALMGSLIDLSVTLNALFLPLPIRSPRLVLGARDLALHDEINGGIPAIYLAWGLSLPYMQAIMLRDGILCPNFESQIYVSGSLDAGSHNHGFFEPCTCVADEPADFVGDILSEISWLLVDFPTETSDHRDEEGKSAEKEPPIKGNSVRGADVASDPLAHLVRALQIFSPPSIATTELSLISLDGASIFADYQEQAPPHTIYLSECKERYPALRDTPCTREQLRTTMLRSALRTKLLDAALFKTTVQRTAVDLIRFDDKDLLPRAVSFLSAVALLLNRPFRLPLFNPVYLRIQPARTSLVPCAAGSIDLAILDQEKKIADYCATLGIVIDTIDATAMRASAGASSLNTYMQPMIPGLNTEIFTNSTHISWKLAGLWKLQPIAFYINFQLYQFLIEGAKAINPTLSFIEVLHQIVSSPRLRPIFNVSLLWTLHDVLCHPKLFAPGMIYMPTYGYFFVKSLFDVYAAGGCLISPPESESFTVAEYYGTVASISGFTHGLHCIYPASSSLVSNMSKSITGITTLTAISTAYQSGAGLADLPNYEAYGINDQELEAIGKAAAVYAYGSEEGHGDDTLQQSASMTSVSALSGTTKDTRANTPLICLQANNVPYLLVTKHLNEGVYTYDLQSVLVSSSPQLSVNLATALLMTKLCNRKFPAFAKQLPSSHILPSTILDLLVSSSYEQTNMSRRMQELLACDPEKPIVMVAKLPQKDDFTSLRTYERMIEEVEADTDPIVPFEIWDDIGDFVVENQEALFEVFDTATFAFDEDFMHTIEAAALFNDIDMQTLGEIDPEDEASYYLQEQRCGIYRTREERQQVSILSKGIRILSKAAAVPLTQQELDLIMLPNYSHKMMPILNMIRMMHPPAVAHGSLKSIKTWSSRDVIRLARCRGLEIGKNVLLGRIHPDNAIAGAKKHPAYESVDTIVQNYQALTQRSVTLGKTELLPVPMMSPSQQDTKTGADSAKGIYAPLFQRYTLLEERGAAPLFDIAQRELRSTVPYTLSTEITVKNTPLVPEPENPPNPSAEDSTNTFLIDYWSISIPKCRHITSERIRSLWNPIWSLEERMLSIVPLTPKELINTPAERILSEEIVRSDAHYNKILSSDQSQAEQEGATSAAQRNSIVQASQSKCACGTFHAVLLPSQSSFPPQTLHQSIFQISPYYVPPDLGDDVSRDAIFTRLVLHAVQETCLLIREYLDMLVNVSRNQIARSKHEAYRHIDDAVWGYILSQIPTDEPYKHMKGHVSPQVWERKGSGKRDMDGPYPLPSYDLQQLIGNRTVEDAVTVMRHMRKGEVHILSSIKDTALIRSVLEHSDPSKYAPQIAILKGIDAWGASFSLDDRIAEIEVFLKILWSYYPLLNPLLFGDVENRYYQTPYCIASAYESGLASIHELEEARCIRFLLRQGVRLENEILDDLLVSQEKLKILSKECMHRRLRAIKVLEIERYNDIVGEVEELCSTYINTVWGKANYTDKRSPGVRMTHEMQMMGAYESDGCLTNDNREFLDLIEEVIHANGLRLGPTWEHEGFDYKDIV